MKYTSAEAAKLIKSLNEQRSALANEIIKKSTFPAAMGEDPETVRPEFNLTEALRTLEKLEERIRRVKHELNMFNATIGLFQSDTSVFYFEADRRIHPVKCKLHLRQLFGNFFEFFLRVLNLVVRVDRIDNR